MSAQERWQGAQPPVGDSASSSQSRTMRQQRQLVLREGHQHILVWFGVACLADMGADRLARIGHEQPAAVTVNRQYARRLRRKQLRQQRGQRRLEGELLVSPP